MLHPANEASQASERNCLGSLRRHVQAYRPLGRFKGSLKGLNISPQSKKGGTANTGWNV